MESTFQILKASWELQKQTDNSNSAYNAKPFLLIKNLESSIIERFYLLEGKYIKFYVTDEKNCIGYEPDQGNWIVCPKNNKTDSGILQCETCEEDDFFSCRKTCQGFQCFPKTPRAKAICDQKETFVYLTYVGGYFKIGVSLNPIRRWIDQGSLYGSILYKGYGLEARFYEHTIGTVLNLKLAVTIPDKINSLGEQIPSRDNIKSEFFKHFASIRKLKLFDLQTDPLIYSLTKYYQKIPELEKKPLIDNNLIKGTVIGVIGRLLVVKDKNSFYVTNLKELLGKVITLEKPLNKVFAKQRTIYDYEEI